MWWTALNWTAIYNFDGDAYQVHSGCFLICRRSYICVCRYIYITILVLTTIFLFSNFTIQIPKRCKDHSSNRSYLGPGQHVGWVHQHIQQLSSVSLRICCLPLPRYLLSLQHVPWNHSARDSTRGNGEVVNGEQQRKPGRWQILFIWKTQLVTWWFHQACKHEWTTNFHCLHQQQLFSTTSQQQFVHMANPLLREMEDWRLVVFRGKIHPGWKGDEIQGPAV